MEYFGGSYTITDSVFGSSFYMGTGLILGPILNLKNKSLLSICKYSRSREVMIPGNNSQ
jgi:hypothetical protein